MAVGAHERMPSTSLPSRSIEFLAVRHDLRRKDLSNGRRCVDVLLDVVIEDAVGRDPLLTHFEARIDQRNLASLGFMTRRGAQISQTVVSGCHPVVLYP